MIIILQLTSALESRTYYYFTTTHDAVRCMNNLFYEVRRAASDGYPYSPDNPAPFDDITKFFQELPDFIAFLYDATISLLTFSFVSISKFNYSRLSKPKLSLHLR